MPLPASTSKRAPALPYARPRIRHARRADLADLVALENATFSGDRLSERQWRYHLGSPRAEVRVAELDGHLAGASVVFYRAGSRRARIYSIAVASSARGNGIGRELLKQIEEDALRRGCAIVNLEVRRDNSGAHGLYERCGFRIIGERAHYYHDGHAALCFEKVLRPQPAMSSR